MRAKLQRLFSKIGLEPMAKVLATESYTNDVFRVSAETARHGSKTAGISEKIN